MTDEDPDVTQAARIYAARESAARALLARRKEAYTRVFAGVPTADDIAVVERDLAAFCRANVTTFDPDPRIHAALEGRREVYLRIAQFRTMTVDELFDVYALGRQ